MSALVREPLFLLAATIGFYLLGVGAQRVTRSAIANPTLIAILLVGAMMRVLHLSYASYFAGTQMLHFLLGPATVALAIPMVLALEHLKRGLGPTLCALAAGAVGGAASGYLLVRWCGGSAELALSMLPKSLTTPIAMGVADNIGGIASLAAVFAILGGILAAVTLMPLLRVLRVKDAAATGLAAGAAGSGITAATMVPLGLVQTAFAGVAIGMNGLMTAVLAPVMVRVLSRF